MQQAPPLPTVLPANGRADQRPPLQRLVDLAQFGALVDRQLGQCRRLDLCAAVLLVEVEPPQPGGAAPDAETAALLQQAIGGRLSGRVRGSDVLVRVGDWRFGLVLMGAGRPEAESVRLRLHKALGGPYGIGEARLQVSLRMGLAVYRENGRSGRELAEVVEQALRPAYVAPAGPLSLVGR